MTFKPIRFDTAGMIFPPNIRKNWSASYRYLVTLKENADEDILKEAAESLRDRFPYLYAGITEDFFHHYLSPNNNEIVIHKDYDNHIYLTKEELRKCFFKISIKEKNIAVDFFHGATDGNGSLIYVKSLVSRYLQLKYGIDYIEDDYTFSTDNGFNSEEVSDDYVRYANDKKQSVFTPFVYHIKDKKIGNHIITTIDLPVSFCKTKSREFGHTINTLFVSLATDAYIKQQKNSTKPVAISIPVNLHSFFKSKAIRNFALVQRIILSRKNSIREIMDDIKKQLDEKCTADNLCSQMNTYSKLQNHPLFSILPLFIKTVLLRISHLLAGESFQSLCISNIGIIRMQEQFNDYVEKIELINSVQVTNHHSFIITTFNDTLTINIARNIEDDSFEKTFINNLITNGFEPKIRVSI